MLILSPAPKNPYKLLAVTCVSREPWDLSMNCLCLRWPVTLAKDACSLASRLDELCEVEVVEADDKTAAVTGRTIIAAGGTQLKQAGGYVFAQTQDDCVVYGMPKAVVEEDLADRTLPLGTIAPAIVRHLNRSRRS